jgi:hypothetical protein
MGKSKRKGITEAVRWAAQAHAERTEKLLLSALTKGIDPILIVPGGKPWEARVVDVSEIYSEPEQEKDWSDWSVEKYIPSEWAPVNEEREEEDHGPFDDLPDESPDDVLDHPEHYTTSEIPSGIECWDHYELGMTEEEFRGAMKNNIYKYIFRAGRKDKNKTVEDLNKAIRYLHRWIKFEEGERIVWMKGQKAK